MTDSTIFIRTKKNRDVRCHRLVSYKELENLHSQQEKPFFPWVAGDNPKSAPSHLLNPSSTTALLFSLACGNPSEHMSIKVNQAIQRVLKMRSSGKDPEHKSWAINPFHCAGSGQAGWLGGRFEIKTRFCPNTKIRQLLPYVKDNLGLRVPDIYRISSENELDILHRADQWRIGVKSTLGILFWSKTWEMRSFIFLVFGETAFLFV